MLIFLSPVPMHEMCLPKTKKLVVYLSKSVHFLRNSRDYTVCVPAAFQYNGRICDPSGYVQVIYITSIPDDILTTYGAWICLILLCMAMHSNTLKDVLGSGMTPSLMLGSKKDPRTCLTWLFFGPVIKVNVLAIRHWPKQRRAFANTIVLYKCVKW